jgi:hypothetical protein
MLARSAARNSWIALLRFSKAAFTAGSSAAFCSAARSLSWSSVDSLLIRTSRSRTSRRRSLLSVSCAQTKRGSCTMASRTRKQTNDLILMLREYFQWVNLQPLAADCGSTTRSADLGRSAAFLNKTETPQRCFIAAANRKPSSEIRLPFGRQHAADERPNR